MSVSAPSFGFAAARIAELERECGTLRQLVASLTARVAAQAEMLGRSAEHRGASAERVRQLETALAPFAAVLATGWDSGELPSDAIYPVPMGDIRQAARALAGTDTHAGK